ncbi:MAG: PrgI family protein [Mycobacteriales bacterium]
MRIPADVERPDRILGGLTAHQLALLAVPGVVLWAGYLGLRRWVPLPVFAALAAPLVIAVAAVALGQRDGLSLDRLLLAGLRQARRPRRLVPAPEGITRPPTWAGHDPQPAPAPLTLPARELAGDGVFDLGDDGAAIVCRVVPVNFALRTPAEQQGLVGGFGRYLNSLTTPVQILIRSTPVDLTATVAALRDAAGGLPHPALETAARDHADYLAALAASRDLLTRDVLLILREPYKAGGAADRVWRTATDATAALAGCGLRVTVLDATAAAGVLSAAADPWSPARPTGLAAPAEIITAATAGGSR